ncbi:LytR/AlgR family response regulator transcription factor [Bacteroidota bacterium]
MVLNCVAIDDEPLALEIISDYVSKVPFLNMSITFDNALDSIDYLKKNKIDLLFLDIEMEKLTGIQFLNVINERPEVIFTTAYDKYAIEGFELEAADYLLKPISFERFVKAVDKVYNKLYSQAQIEKPLQNLTISNPIDNYFFVKTENRLEKLFFHDILYVEGQGDYLRITLDNKRIMTLQSFSKIETILPKNNFIRVHKSFLVAIDKIDSIVKNKIRINDAYIPIGESYKKDFFKKLEGKRL